MKVCVFFIFSQKTQSNRCANINTRERSRMCLLFSDWPGLWCIILNVALGKKSLDTPDLFFIQLIWPSGKASTSGAVDSGLISRQIKAMTLKLVTTAFLLCFQHCGDSVENKPASLLVPLERALNGIPPSWCGRQMAGNSYASSL